MRARALRKMETFHRGQTVFGGVMERDDELRAIIVVHKTLMKLREPDARARVVKYMVERHVMSHEPAGVAIAPVPADGEAPPTSATPAEATEVATRALGQGVLRG